MSQFERLSKWVKSPVESAKASVQETKAALRAKPRLSPVVERLDDLVDRHLPAVMAPIRSAEKVTVATLKDTATVATAELRAFVRGRGPAAEPEAAVDDSATPEASAEAPATAPSPAPAEA